MKTAPVFHALRRVDSLELLLVHTGQHYDSQMSDVLLSDLNFPKPDVFLGVGSGTHGEQTARALLGVEEVLLQHRPVLTVVAGDVNSTLAAALAAAKLHIPVAHIESGLRSFDNEMPEEHNRRLTDHLSDILLAHSASAVANLEREGIDLNRVHVVGNTMIDSLLEHLPKALAREPWRDFGVAPGKYALVTLHRPALVDDPNLLRTTIDHLEHLSKTFQVLFPVHPRTRAHLETLDLLRRFDGKRLILTQPLSYLSFLGVEARAALVLTDSGGVQEETSALGVPCFTLRESTERPVTTDLGTNILLGCRPERISEIPSLLQTESSRTAIPLWDGHAGERAAAILLGFLDD